MDSGYFNIQEIRKHLEGLERELIILKRLLETPAKAQGDENEKQIQELREQLISEGFDKELVQLVGTVPLYNIDYKEEIRNLIYERFKRSMEDLIDIAILEQRQNEPSRSLDAYIADRNKG